MTPDHSHDHSCASETSLVTLGVPAPRRQPRPKAKRPLNVYTVELNIVMGKGLSYLPYSTGLLRAYAETFPAIKAAYRFQPFLYKIDAFDAIMARFTEEPDVAAFSVSMWNEQLSLAVAAEVKKRWPNCLTIFGGCSTPHHPGAYMAANPFIDVAVRAEGEEALADVLIRYLDSDEFDDIPQVTYRRGEQILEDPRQRAYRKDMDCFPSPYLTGLFDYLLDGTPFQNIIETNRGCFVAGTLVQTDGGPVPIELVRPGQRVLTRKGYGVVKHAGETKRVREVLSTLFSSGSVLTSTPDHRVWTDNRGWVEAVTLNPQDTVQCCHETGMSWDGRSPVAWPVHFQWRRFDEDVPVYDIEVEGEPEFFANGILVHNCPFDCSFCYWAAGGLALKYRFHSLDYVKDEITWTGRRQIKYMFAADSNFAMHPRDREIAEHAVAVKRQYGAPEKLRVCWGKNTDEKIFEVAGILHAAELEKGITLARQSNDETTLKNIRRDNISLDTYRNLQARFVSKGVPVYMELILGLPGETVESWKRGLDDCLISAGSGASMFCYLAQQLPNTELADPAYKAKHGIVTRAIELQEFHCAPRGPEYVKEVEEIVVATASMPHAHWREMCKHSWMTMFLHSMKAGFYPLAWLWGRLRIPPSTCVAHLLHHATAGSMIGVEIAEWERLLDKMEAGGGRGQILSQFGAIYWDVEESALLRASRNWARFYEEMATSLKSMLSDRPEPGRGEELAEVLAYQQLRMPSAGGNAGADRRFAFNVPEYFDKLHATAPVPLVRRGQTLRVPPKDWAGDYERFARETVLWGRKSGTMMLPCAYEDAVE